MHPRGHRFGKFDPVNGDAARCQGEGDPAGADAEFQRSSAAGSLSKKVDDGVNDLRIEDLWIVVVVCGNLFAKEAVIIHRGMTTSWGLRCLSQDRQYADCSRPFNGKHWLQQEHLQFRPSWPPFRSVRAEDTGPAAIDRLGGEGDAEEEASGLLLLDAGGTSDA